MKSAPLVELHREHQAGFAGRFVRPQFGPAGTAAGFDAQRVDARGSPGVASQAEVSARLFQCIVYWPAISMGTYSS